MALRLVTTVLAASSCHAQFPTQETISEMPFGFWYILQDDIIACEPEQYQQCVALFGPIYTALVNAMLHKSMYDPDDGEWSTAQREALRCYRTGIADTIRYSFNILRDGLLHSLLQHLDHAIAACLNAPRPGRPSRHASTPGTPWPSPSPTARRRRPTPALHVPGQAPRHPLPQQHTGDLHRAGLHRRVLRLAGHAPPAPPPRHPDRHLGPHLPRALPGRHHGPQGHLEGLHGLDEAFRRGRHRLHPAVPAGEPAEPRGVRATDVPAGQDALPDPRHHPPRLHPIVAKPLEELHQLSKGPPDNNAKARLLFVLKLLTMLFTTLDIHIQNDQPESEAAISAVDSRREKVEQPVLVFLRPCLPVYQQLCSTYSTDSEISEAVCLNLKQAVAILQDDMRPLTQEVLPLALASYRAAPQPAALELSKQFFIMYGREEGMMAPLRSLLTCLTTCHLQVGSVTITGTEVSLATVTLMETPGLRQLRLAISQDRLTSAMEHAEIIHDPGYIAAQQQAGTEARRDEEEGEGMEVDPAFSDSIRHVMDGGLPDSLKHIISNAEYYGPNL